MKSNSYAGIHMQYQQFDVHFDPEDSLWTQDLRMIGTDYFKHGIVGGVYMYDSRDHILAPRKGMFLETMINYGLGEADGSRTIFWQMMVDVRKYFLLNERNVIATHGLFQTCSGVVPFRIFPSLGGPLIHRGYYMGRFRDKHAALLQAEWRYSFPKKWGFTVFSSVGKVSNTFKELNLSGLHPALGTGLRYRMSQRDQTTIRLDYSKTPDSQGVYLYFAEAF